MFLYLLLPFVVLSSHRLWNREVIFRGLKSRLDNFYPLSCSACNLFWIALFWSFLVPYVDHIVLREIYIALALYAPIRAAIWLYDIDLRTRYIIDYIKRKEEPFKPKKKGCSSCRSAEEVRQEAAQARERQNRAAFIIDHDWGERDKESAGLYRHIVMLATNPDWFVKVIVPHYNQLEVFRREVSELEDTKFKFVVIPDMAKATGFIKKQLMNMGNGSILTYGLGRNQNWATICRSLSTFRGFAFYQYAYDETLVVNIDKSNYIVAAETEDGNQVQVAEPSQLGGVLEKEFPNRVTKKVS